MISQHKVGDWNTTVLFYKRVHVIWEIIQERPIQLTSIMIIITDNKTIF